MKLIFFIDEGIVFEDVILFCVDDGVSVIVYMNGDLFGDFMVYDSGEYVIEKGILGFFKVESV